MIFRIQCLKDVLGMVWWWCSSSSGLQWKYIINVIQITGYRDAFYIVNESQFVECQNKETMHNGKVLKIKTFGTFLINLKLQTGCCSVSCRTRRLLGGRLLRLYVRCKEELCMGSGFCRFIVASKIIWGVDKLTCCQPFSQHLVRILKTALVIPEKLILNALVYILSTMLLYSLGCNAV